MQEKHPIFVVAAAIFDTSGRILIAERPVGKDSAGLWEFPSGKIESCEPPPAALARELKEELGILICEECLEPLTFVNHRSGDRDITVLLWACRTFEGVPLPYEGQRIDWVYPHQLRSYPFLPADLFFIAFLEKMANLSLKKLHSF